jgi:DNA-binding NarL/FixJ family response regulator
MRVLLADDQAKVRSALRLILEQEPGMEIVGEAAGVARLLALVKERYPDLILLDWELRKAPANDLLPALRSLCPCLKVIVLSARPEARQAALAAGADAFVSKVDGPEALLNALQNTIA